MSKNITPADAEALLATLRRICDRATRPVLDSCDQPVVSIRKALLDEARALVARIEEA